MTFVTIGLDNEVRTFANCTAEEAYSLTKKEKLVNQPKGVTIHDRCPLVFEAKIVFQENGGYESVIGECVMPYRIQSFKEMQSKLGYPITTIV